MEISLLFCGRFYLDNEPGVEFYPSGIDIWGPKDIFAKQKASQK
jgi:hypothetical protein